MGKGLIVGMLIGGALGAGIALLYAPKPGKKLRSELREKADSMIADGQEYLATVQAKATEIVDDARRSISEMIAVDDKEPAGTRSRARTAAAARS